MDVDEIDILEDIISNARVDESSELRSSLPLMEELMSRVMVSGSICGYFLGADHE